MWDIYLLACPWLCFPARSFDNSSISRNDFLGLGLALSQDLVEDDRAESCGTDATKGEAADVENKVASAKYESHCDGYQIASLGEIDAVLDPNATGCGGNQAKEHYSKPTDHTRRNGCDQRSKLRAEPQENRDTCRDYEDYRRVDAGHGHCAYIF